MKSWILRKLGCKRVLLIDVDGEITERWAVHTPDGWLCKRGGIFGDTCLLLPEGVVVGTGYVRNWISWEPEQ